MALRSRALICHTPLKFNIWSYLSTNGVKPNFTRPVFEKLHIKSVGFHSVSDGCGVSGESCVFYDFTVLVLSIQPWGNTQVKTPANYVRVLSKIDTYGAVVFNKFCIAGA